MQQRRHTFGVQATATHPNTAAGSVCFRQRQHNLANGTLCKVFPKVGAKAARLHLENAGNKMKARPQKMSNCFVVDDCCFDLLFGTLGREVIIIVCSLPSDPCDLPGTSFVRSFAAPMPA